jgi:hypothetical protein
MRNLDPVWLAHVRDLAAAIREVAEGDADALLDTLDGETDAADVARALVRLHVEVSGLMVGAKAMKDHYARREKALIERDDAIRRELARLMDAVGERTLRLPEATVSVRQGRPELILPDDLSGLPDDLIRVKREADKVAIRNALDEGREVPGVMLGNAAPVLTIRST